VETLTEMVKNAVHSQRIAHRFEIRDPEKDLLGRGSMGEVYRATDNHTGKPVAVKALDPRAVARDPSILERFAREGEALRQLNHPNIVRMVAAVEQDGQHYLVMEYVAGGSLQDLLTAQRPLPTRRVLEIALELADALTRAHHLGIIHRDLKPANVLLAEDGTPRLTDFGIARVSDSPRLTETGILVGTPDFLSPEACSGRALDERTDIWAFGVLLFEMLTGETPFRGDNLTAKLTAILTQPVPDLGKRCPDAPEALVDLVYRMLEKDRGQRIPSVRLVGAELEAILKGREVSTPVRLAPEESRFSTPSPPPGPVRETGGPKQIAPELSQLEQDYRARLKARYAEDAAYFVPLAGETTEVVSKREPTAPRSTRRRKRRAQSAYHEWVQKGQDIKRVKLETLREAVDKYPCIILLGDPGSGKTTALENLAYQFADEPDRLPVPLRLSEFGSGMSLDEFILQGWGGSPEADYWGASELAAKLEYYLDAGRLFILFDALNEMPHEGYRERTLALRHFIDEWSAKGNRFLVTCRVLDYGEELSGLQRVEVQPLNDEQTKTFLQKELPETWQGLWQSLTESSDDQCHLLEMARNPYVLTIMIDVFDEDGRLGQNRAELMERFTQILMAWAKAKTAPNQWLDPDVQREALSVMAFEMQARSGFGTTVKTEYVKTVMPSAVQPDPNWPPQSTPPDQILSLAAAANIIEMPVDRVTVRFYHQLLQEYFAAHQMLKRGVSDPAGFEKLSGFWKWPWLESEMPLWVRPKDNHEPLPPPPPTGWEETTILAAGLALKNDDQLVRTLLQINPVLAGRCLVQGQAKVDPALHQAVLDQLLSTVANPEVALRVRVAAGNMVGYLGDPRIGEMVIIPAGEFIMGEGREQHELFLPSYRLGKYPLTNAEYEQFIKADGYNNKQWWTKAGWEQIGRRESEPRLWQDSRFNKPNQPVLGLSWYEAVAYCHWLSADSGQLYRLPTEAEWEKGARGVDGRTYPWGNEFEASRLNIRAGEQQVEASTPVGIYPTGVSHFGIFDCAGNVWEWCATRWPKPYPYNAEEDEWQADYLEGKRLRVLRSGSWNFGHNVVRCGYRFRFGATGWADRGGFRLVSPI
jgi:serine/threonine protein kinase/formylglycine-generating enzyme required for sulfatase activity